MTSHYDDSARFDEGSGGREPGAGRGFPRAGSEVILVAEDDDACRRLVVRILEDASYRVLQARDGVEALRICATHNGPIHLLLTDVVMPGANGPQVADFLCARRPATQVLFMSAWPSAVGKCCGVRREEAAAILAKPFTAELLRRKVRDLLATPVLAFFDA